MNQSSKSGKRIRELAQANALKTQQVQIGSQFIGGPDFAVIGGPCSIESFEQTQKIASLVNDLNLGFFRGGMYKLRTHPESFQGLGEAAFDIIRELKKTFGFQFVSEITDPRQIESFLGIVDVFQVGSRNMHNYALLKDLGQIQTPVLLKRGFSGLIKEWLLSAEYIASGGNPNVVLCERGIRTFESATRNTLDLNAVAYVKEVSHFPVIVDPSHGTGQTSLVEPLALAAAAVGADGLMIEVHPNPSEALSDGFQALDPLQFRNLISKLEPLLELQGRRLSRPSLEREKPSSNPVKLPLENHTGPLHQKETLPC